ncbi:short-chain dehydrogenase [Stenotrophomonas panacihumi]|uniref:Short-chain dehydrogenase n=1 Tax=Stenotrophomonas panacihumi TaxID=676599 RepID=A0A0Q9ZZT6_9GAMM|nr:oxidoreductase [Stenotrophomonas panacihumi]KRG38447.1 short-chain dehydrogenase [Stenotrophomonas panacihumi]PTN54344.1 KR domain-containing protein [Stenotrophomonas panacihumi]
MSTNPTDRVIPTWFITGANRGLGAAIARAALRAGFNVVAAARRPASVEAALGGDHAGKLFAVALDVTDAAQVRQAVDGALARFGRIDVLVNNAGYGQLGPFEEIADEAIRTQFDTNVFGLMQVTRAVLPTMRAQRAGQIFNISSVGGLAGFAGASVYCASKFAVQGFSASLAPELAPFGIRVTSVSPGFFRTDFLDNSSIRYGDQGVADYADASSALRSQYDGYSHQQAGDPDKLADALLAVAADPRPTVHFVVGADAMDITRQELDRVQADIATWADTSAATAHA